MAVAGAEGAVTRGVDSTAATSDALRSGKQLAQEYGCIVGISGAVDLVWSHSLASMNLVPFSRRARHELSVGLVHPVIHHFVNSHAS